MFNEIEMPVALQYPAHFAKCGINVGNRTQGPRAYDGIVAVVIGGDIFAGYLENLNRRGYRLGPFSREFGEFDGGIEPGN